MEKKRVYSYEVAVEISNAELKEVSGGVRTWGHTLSFTYHRTPRDVDHDYTPD